MSDTKPETQVVKGPPPRRVDIERVFRLSPRKFRAALLMASGMPDKNVAQQCGVKVRQFYHWKREFRSMLLENNYALMKVAAKITADALRNVAYGIEQGDTDLSVKWLRAFGIMGNMDDGKLTDDDGNEIPTVNPDGSPITINQQNIFFGNKPNDEFARQFDAQFDRFQGLLEARRGETPSEP